MLTCRQGGASMYGAGAGLGGVCLQKGPKVAVLLAPSIMLSVTSHCHPGVIACVYDGFVPFLWVTLVPGPLPLSGTSGYPWRSCSRGFPE